MAEQSVSITTSRSVSPFSGLPSFTENSYLPRGMISYQASGAAIAAKTLGNTMTVTTTCTLPENFAYSLTGLSILVDCTTAKDASQFDVVGYAQVENDNAAPITTFIELFSRGPVGVSSNAGDRLMWTPQSKWCPLMFNLTGNSPELQVVLTDNDTANAADARRCFFQADFLIYDIRQVTDVRVNAPMPVRTC